MTEIKFADFTRGQHELAAKIGQRAKLEVFEPQGVDRQVLDTVMDLAAVHYTCPLDLEKLLGFDKANFGHDIAGIFNKLDRETGELGDFFLPRCALPVTVQATITDLHRQRVRGVTYYATVDPEELKLGYSNDGQVHVRQRDGSIDALDPRFDLANHSPTGFAWNYLGSGPAQLALAMLAHASGDDAIAMCLYQQYKLEVLAMLREPDWQIPGHQVLEWLDDQELEPEKLERAADWIETRADRRA